MLKIVLFSLVQLHFDSIYLDKIVSLSTQSYEPNVDISYNFLLKPYTVKFYQLNFFNISSV